MANDKDFILKNAVEVGGPTKVTLGTITSSDIDLSTGNYFSDTLASNTTYTISNAGDVQAFQLEVTGGASGYNLANADYDSVSFDPTAQTSTSMLRLTLSADGTKMYVSNFTTWFQYSLSTAWDISTASYDSKSFNPTEAGTVRGMRFKPDGTKIYVMTSSEDAIFQYSLSTAWDISTASYDSKSLDVSGQEGTPLGLEFKIDGTSLYVSGNDFGGDVYQYDLSTAWDVSTGSYASKTLDTSAQDGVPQGLFFNPDGTELFMVGNGTDTIYKYDLSTAWDLSTASYASVSFSVASQDTAPAEVIFKSDGTKMYIAGTQSDEVYQYSTFTGVTLTWPSSIEWAGGVSPAAPANGETDVFTITTDDGGTTYTGVKTADNLS